MYVDAFRRRADARAAPCAQPIEGPGLYGYDGPDHGRLLVVDDRAAPVLAELVGELTATLVMVLDTAPACRSLLEASESYAFEDTGAAMVRVDLDGLPDVVLPESLTLARVDPDGPATEGVTLEAAIAACARFDPAENGRDMVPHIRRAVLGLPHPHILAAADSEGRVRATAASGRFDSDALVIFVTTDPALRGRGIATAMTAEALRASREAGAVRACLDASAMGEPIYRRLGFETVARLTRFVHVDA
jgi:predicted GNAT family acetyltransferase